jgi:uncharacterized protein (TIRG00374 family)
LNKNIKKALGIILPILLGIYLIWASLKKLSPEDVSAIKESFQIAEYKWIALSLFFASLSHLSRAYRWRFLLEPMGYKVSYINCLLTVALAYFMNLGIPRSGELARAAALSKAENIPFDKTFGSIVAERATDVLMLLVIIGLVFMIQFDYLVSLLSESFNPTKIIISLIILVAIIITIVVFLKKSTNTFAVKIKKFFGGIGEGLKSILHTPKKWAYFFHTVFIWLMYILMFYVVGFAFPETSNLSLSAIMSAFVIGSLSMMLTNGGIGAYPLGVQKILGVYGVAKVAGLAFGWMMWTAQTILVIAFGVLAFVLIPIYNSKYVSPNKATSE